MEEAEESTALQPDRFNCPGCGEQVEVSPDALGQLVRCPYCNTDFFASHHQSHLPVVDDTLPPVADEDRELAFDKLRIEQHKALRMGAIRSRSWWLIGMCLAGAAALDMLIKAIRYLWFFHHLGFEPAFRLLGVFLLVPIARHAWRRAAAFKHEIDRSAIAEPAVPPDFSTLGDGSDQWKKLENIH